MDPRYVLITGAASGLGLGLAHQLAAKGHSLLLVDRDGEALFSAENNFSEYDVSVYKRTVDLSYAASINECAESWREMPVEVLVNNAGLQHVEPVESFPVTQWDLLMDVMLRGSFLMSQAFLPGMRKRGHGRIINIGSIHSLVASPYKSAYVTAKHGLVGLTKTLALETADTDITVNTICPAYIHTPLVDKQIFAQAQTRGISREEVIEQIMLKPMPKGQFITVEEVAGAIEFLISPLARNITGQCLTIDGGWTAH